MQEEGNDEISGIVESKVSRMEVDCKFACRIDTIAKILCFSAKSPSGVFHRYSRVIRFLALRHSALEQFESLPSITVGMSKRKMEESS